MSDILTTLRKVQALLSEPKRYTSGAYARNTEGLSTYHLAVMDGTVAKDPNDIPTIAAKHPEAYQFCFMGAWYREGGDGFDLAKLESLVRARFASSIVANSDRSHESCMEMIKFLLEKAEEGKL